MTRRPDIIDEIGALVDEQLSRYDERSGYDYNVGIDKCPHCDGEWHGLPITERVREMRAYYCGCPACADQLDQYRVHEDDSPIWCPGSEFIGPWANQAQLRRIREGMTSTEWGWWVPDEYWRRMGMTRRSDGGNAAIAAAQSFIQGAAGLPYVWPSHDDEAAESGQGGQEDFRVYLLGANGERTEIGVVADEVTTWTDEYDRVVYSFTVQAQRMAENLGVATASISEAMARLRPQFGDAWATFRAGLPGDLTEAAPELRTPRERALPRPSEEPPMWAIQPNRQRRRRNRR
ncbi:hypothetical protein NXT08_22410 [Rhodococcus pyridinivorans]|uniref:hypothetical protein n=1 Tax=Rhodococcus pyridinivorans TaxID=103816 RepID=UPI0021649E0A|nr:hypothetical protein [Rhodococcus pyridinivorans]UVT24957.1 hypothetical protein NXT08_22410 [Rhodococcus pyridinivorans]